MQQQLQAMLLADGDELAGYKVGLTSTPMQRLVGVDCPAYGPVLASTVHHDAEPVALNRFIAPKPDFRRW